MLLALGAPAILFAGALCAFLRTYRNRRRHDGWLAWQGAGWTLLTLALVVTVMSLSPLAGPSLR